MSTLILFTSTHGTTEKAVKLLQQKLTDKTDIVQLKKNPGPDPSGYNTIILGTSIHAGRSSGKMQTWFNANKQVLLQKKLGLFLCCMYEGDVALKQFNENYPDDLRNHSAANGLFGGEFLMEKMNFFEKLIVKKVAKITESVSKLDPKAIEEFAEKMKK